MLFTTDRLLARRLTKNDVDAMLAIYGDAETVRFVGNSERLTRESCGYWVEVTDRNFEKRGYGMVAFADRETGEVIGCGGIVHPDQQPEAEIKYAFRRDQWGRGYASEAIAGLIRFARESWGVGRILATVFPENLASQKVLVNLGFKRGDDRNNEDGSATQVWGFGSEPVSC